MKNILLIAFCLSTISSFAQDDLLDLLDEQTPQETYIVEATFKGTRILNGHSVETRRKNNLDFLISHRFGKINGGAYQLFGLDQSNVRISFDYGVTDRFNIGIGRNSFEKTFDGYLKYRLLRQSSGAKAMPLSVTLFTSSSIKTLRDEVFKEVIDFNDKLAFTSQVLLARKINANISLQLMPTYVHFNTIRPEQKKNDIYALGGGGRFKLSQRISVNAEYYHQFNRLVKGSKNAIGIGFDIETGGHVFQLHFTNSQSMVEKGFIAEGRNDFFAGDIHFGFNISRTFQLGGEAKKHI
ncbi:MAG: hypothetical protein JXR03_17500 [Cyclobacteriaceae bacterium]